MRSSFGPSVQGSPSRWLAAPSERAHVRSSIASGAPLDPSTQSRVVGGRSRLRRRSHVILAVASRRSPSSPRCRARVGRGVSPATTSSTSSAAWASSSVPLAKAVGPSGRVTAVESSPYAVRDARENAVGLKQLKVREWSVTPRSVNDTVREGSDRRTRSASSRSRQRCRRRDRAPRPRRVVYVSCDAATFARDLKDFLGNGFVLSDLRVFDLFPMTEHVELVALLDSPS